MDAQFQMGGDDEVLGRFETRRVLCTGPHSKVVSDSLPRAPAVPPRHKTTTKSSEKFHR